MGGMTPGRLVEIDTWIAQWHTKNRMTTGRSAIVAADELRAEVGRLTAERDQLRAALEPAMGEHTAARLLADVQASHDLRTALGDAVSVLALRGWPDLADRVRTAWQAYTHDDLDTTPINDLPQEPTP